jgi:hypothetical protein
MTVPPMEYSAITMTDRYANPADERGKESAVPTCSSSIALGLLLSSPSLERSHLPRHTSDVCVLTGSSVLSPMRQGLL